MLAGSAGLVMEHNDVWPGLQSVAAVDPEVRPMGLAAAGIELPHLCLLGMQNGAGPQQLVQASRQGIQGHLLEQSRLRQQEGKIKFRQSFWLRIT